MRNLLDRYKVVVNPKVELSWLIRNDKGNLIRETDFLFLIFAVIRTLNLIVSQWHLNNQPWMVLLLLVFGIVGGYLITRYLLSFLIYKVSGFVVERISLDQSRFLLSNSLIPLILYFIVSLSIQLLLNIEIIDAQILLKVDNLVFILAYILAIRIMILGVIEIYEFEIQKALIIASPLIIFFAINFL